MDRREFLRVVGAGLAAAPLAGCRPTQVRPTEEAAIAPSPAVLPPPARLPVVFTAHGNPMHAITDGVFPQFLREWGGKLPRPKAAVVISAHYESDLPLVTVSAQPETYHDFSGFPDELFAVRYPCPGSPAVAERAMTLLETAGFTPVRDEIRGLDHGVWAPLLHLWPKADIPIVEVSLLYDVPGPRHIAMGRALAPLRDEGVLLLGSGNLTHNLRTARFGPGDDAPEDRARSFDAWVKRSLEAWDLDALAAWETAHKDGKWAHPTADHYVPLLVIAGAADAAGRPKLTHRYEAFEGRTLSMRCVEMA